MVCHTHPNETAVKARRNSSIELLRLWSMLMIVGFHYVLNGGGAWISEQPVSVSKFIYQMIYMSGGWIGNFIFFVISIWYLLDRDLSLRSSLRRIWILERELLFWSLSLLLVTIWLRREGIYSGGISVWAAKSVLPLSTGLWWYPTSYALFLLFMPFLARGVRALGCHMHKRLALICLTLWGFLGLIPKIDYNLSSASVFVFIYWFILISYYRWYMHALTVKQCWGLIGAGVAVMLLYWSATNILFACTGKMAKTQVFIFDHWKLPTMMIGFGIFMLVVRTHFYSRVVNFVAASAFGVYLIHYYPPIWFDCITKYVGVEVMYDSRSPILFGAAAIGGIFFVCLMLDMVRNVLFHFTVDRHRGRCFDRLYAWCAKNPIQIRSHSSLHDANE